MALSSVNTNMSAMVALQALQATNSQLQTIQKHVSTGFRVADAVDDGAAYAVAQAIRSTVGALTSANQQLGSVQGLLQTTKTGLNDTSNTMASMRNVLVKLSDSTTTGADRTNYIQQYNSMLANVKTFIQDANYNGKTLIGDLTGSNGTFSRVAVARNEVGSTYGIATFSGSALFGSIAFTSTQMAGAATVAALISASGTFITQFNAVSKALNTVGSEVNYVNNQVSYNSDKIDALNVGIGSLVDADLAKESAQLQALQIRQQLGTQALSIANQAPAALLNLFK
ncbi:MAG: flagellin [Acetobacteraceae bacterium]|nr:flagellin [Acetobacteraceae bacterium]